ncbi:hypothetical protein ACHAWF_012877 [Thalassiosira exigua]
MSNKKNRGQARLFSTLDSIERVDRSATKRRRRSRLDSLRESRAAADQARLGGILLELRILTQRCLTEAEAEAEAEVEGERLDGSPESDGSGRATEEVDALLENLLVARRDLLGGGGSGRPSIEGGEKGEVDCGASTRPTDASGKDRDDFSGGKSASGSSSGGGGSGDGFAEQLQREYEVLRNDWESVLNKHHSNLALHSGMAVDGAKFQSRAVNVSFWEQVRGGAEHERSKRRTTEGGGGAEDDGAEEASRFDFDDSKLYQQMLKDFVSSSGAHGGGAPASGGGAAAADPAREAAERLKRAVRKRSGGAGDVDLAPILAPEVGGSHADATRRSVALAKKNAPAVDRRASKGRKIRYSVLPKLVNFAFPVARPEQPKIGEEVWFKSLFGGVGNQ